jgi:hypothetical protein
MKISRILPALMISIIMFSSCEKEDDQESNLPKTYLDSDNFVSEGLVAYYPFNGNVNDFSGNGLNGIPNEVTYSSDRFDKQGGACLFDGNNSYIEVENSNLLNGNTYTICFWYRADLNDTLEQSVVSKSDTSGYGFTIDLYNSYSFSNLGFAYRNRFLEIQSWMIFGSPVGEWVAGSERSYEFAAVAFSETEFIDYFGGKEQSHDPATFFNANEYKLYIGRSDNDYYKKFTGELDDLLIYNRILTYEEIEKLYSWKREE